MDVGDHGTPQIEWGKKKQVSDCFEAIYMPNTTQKKNSCIKL